MKKDKLKIYIIEVLLIITLLFALFVSNTINKKILALIIFAFALIIHFFIKKKARRSIYDKQVTWLMSGFGIIYLIAFYLMGLYFGYYKAPTVFGFNTIINFIIPFVIIIISSEYIRQKLIFQKGKLTSVLAFIIMVLIDLIIYTGVYDISNLDDMLAVVGFILFASIACNLLYHYTTKRFGNKGVIIYRLITVLYVYFIPYIPNVYIFFRSFLRMIYPYIIYMVLEHTYSKSSYYSPYRSRSKNVITTSILFIVLTLLIALISCSFKYGIIVVGSGSMTGTINKGDAVIFERYDKKVIKKDDVIVFKKEEMKTIHRLVEIENYNNQYRYYTKGDANKDIDDGYILKKDIMGKVKLRIPYIGYPTIWIRDIFKY